MPRRLYLQAKEAKKGSAITCRWENIIAVAGVVYLGLV